MSGTYIVSGGASRLGAAIVRRLHGAGHNVVVADVDQDAADALCAALEERCVAAACDVCLLYTSPSPRDQRGSRMPSSA